MEQTIIKAICSWLQTKLNLYANISMIPLPAKKGITIQLKGGTLVHCYYNGDKIMRMSILFFTKSSDQYEALTGIFDIYNCFAAGEYPAGNGFEITDVDVVSAPELSAYSKEPSYVYTCHVTVDYRIGGAENGT